MSELLKRLGKEKVTCLIGFVLLGVSAFLLWVWFTYLYGGVITLTGLQVANGEPGIVALVFTLLGIALILGYSSTKRCGFVVVGLALFMMFEVGIVGPQLVNLTKTTPWGAGIGAGLYLNIVASVTVVAGGILLIKLKHVEKPPPKEEQTPSPKTKYCIKCGASVKENAAFCEECGQKIETQQSPKS